MTFGTGISAKDCDISTDSSRMFTSVLTLLLNGYSNFSKVMSTLAETRTLRMGGWDESSAGVTGGADSGAGVADPSLRRLVGAEDAVGAWLGSSTGIDEGTISGANGDRWLEFNLCFESFGYLDLIRQCNPTQHCRLSRRLERSERSK